MDIITCIFMSLCLPLMVADGFDVRGPSAPLSVPLGSSVVLSCYVDEALPVEDLEVEWRRADSETLIHLYQDEESRAEVQQQDYHDRAHFFTEEIQHGNFSLRLDNLTAQDEGEYRCTVHSQQDSGETLAEIKNIERLLVSGPDKLVSAYVDGDVTLNCSVDSHITPEHIEEVSWRKTDKYGDITVLLYEKNKTVSEATHEEFRGRVEFFTAEIPKGNFSLRLKSVRTEDKGVYRCQVFAGDLSANATVELTRLGFSGLHIIMMILCISAFGSAPLFCFLIYCRSPTKGLFVQKIYDGFWSLGSSVVLPCHVDRKLLKKNLKVEWRRTDPETLVHLYEDGECRPEKQHKDYENRAHFTEHVQRGNFSFHLVNLRPEDAGKYRCTVYSDQECVHSEVKLKLRFELKRSYASVFSRGSVVLPCEVDKPLLQKSLKVEWRRAETLIYLYQDGESRPMKQNKEGHHRAHLDKKEKIKEGNFSLCLDKLRAEDAGKYTCKVYSDQDCVYSVEREVVMLGFQVEHTHHTLAPLAPSVVLPCYVDEALPLEDLKVEWTKPATETVVHLFLNGESRPEAQHQDYRGRAHFFTEEIQHGNFSLHLDNLTAQDEGEYRCTVYRNQKEVFSDNKKLRLRLLDTAFFLHMILVFCPNILMFLAFLLWGFSEGSLNESVSCCALYFLRPLLLLWAAPYIEEFKGKIYRWILKYSYIAEYIVLSVAVYSASFASAWQRIMNFAEVARLVVIVLFVIIFLSCFCKVIHFLVAEVGGKNGRIIKIFDAVAIMIFEILPCLQFMILFYTFESPKKGSIFIVILPLLVMMINEKLYDVCYYRIDCSHSVSRGVRIFSIIFTNGSIIGFYLYIFYDNTDAFGWTFVLIFLLILWIIMKMTDYGYTFSYINDGFPRAGAVYVFGSVAVVVLNSALLMTELILKTVTGDRSVKDLRFVVFLTECLFAVFLMVSSVFPNEIKSFQKFCQNLVKCKKRPARRSQQNQNTTENIRLRTEDQEQNPLESVKTQT